MKSAEQNDPQTYAIIGAAMEVPRELGHGFLESVYQEAMALEMADRDIPFDREVELPVHFKARRLKSKFRADFVCHGNIVVELKAMSELTSNEEAQLINYLKATGHHRGLLLNFGAPKLEWMRRVFGRPPSTDDAEDQT